MNRRNFLKRIIGTAATLVAAPVIPSLPISKAKNTAGSYAWQQQGFAVLDNRRILMGDFSKEAPPYHLLGNTKVAPKQKEVIDYGNVQYTPSSIEYEGQKFDRIPLFDAEGIIFGIESGV